MERKKKPFILYTHSNCTNEYFKVAFKFIPGFFDIAKNLQLWEN